MNILAIDTSTKNYSLAISSDDQILAQVNLHLPDVLEDSVIPGIERLLFLSKLTLAQVDGFVAGLGPGSFTSLRVGISTVKALAWSTGRPIVGISSLDAIAANAEVEEAGQIAVLCDARRNMVFGCLYQKTRNELKALTDYLLVPPQKILERIHSDTFFTGNGISLFAPMMAQAAKKQGWKASFAPEHQWLPNARTFISLSLPKFLNQELTAASDLLPLYLYPEDCQVTQ